MTEIFCHSLRNIDKETGLRISCGKNLHLLPSTDADLKVKVATTGEVLGFRYVASGRVIGGSDWQNFIRRYQRGAIITLYKYEGPDARYKIEVRETATK